MAIRWNYQAEMINACNCDWGCPCNFNARPTTGSCAGVYAAHITNGFCGDTRLDGVKYAWAVSFPGAVHEGGGTARIWMDETASAPQRSGVEDILRGTHGGMPWTILAATIDTWLETTPVPFEWKFDGARSSYKAGSAVHATLEPMRNPVTGLDTSATILLPNGLVCKKLDVTATRAFAVFSPGLKFAAPGKYGFYTTTEHGN